MDQDANNYLAELRVRARRGEEFNPTILALYQDLVAQEACEQVDLTRHCTQCNLTVPVGTVVSPVCFGSTTTHNLVDDAPAPTQPALGRPLPLADFYSCKPTDKRIKSTLIIVNEAVSPPRELSAVILCDGGAEGDRVTLPARKILQLGLTPVPRASGGVVITKSSNNTRSIKLIFSPQVTVRIQFTRPNSAQVEERAVLANVTCSEDDWNAANTTASSPAPETTSPIVEPSSPLPPIPLGPHVLAAIQLSPIGHRISGEGIVGDRKDEACCAVGEGILEKLGAHSNHALHILEIKEEVIEED